MTFVFDCLPFEALMSHWHVFYNFKVFNFIINTCQWIEIHCGFHLCGSATFLEWDGMNIIVITSVSIALVSKSIFPHLVWFHVCFLVFGKLTLGNLKRRYFPTFGDAWRQMATATPNLATATPNWRQQRQIGDSIAKLATATPSWRQHRQIWQQQCQVGDSIAKLAILM